MSSKGWKNHYENLELKENSTPEEIKQAYFKLSKEYHPDSQSKGDHAKFLQINESYSVLKDPILKRSYDSTIIYYKHQHQYQYQYKSKRYTTTNLNDRFDIETDAPPQMWRDESIYAMRDRSKDRPYDGNYYGIKGIKRVSNNWIAFGCMIFIGVGTIFHLFAINSSRTFTVKKLDNKDARLGKILSEVKKKAAENGNDLQLRRILIGSDNSDD